MSDLHSLDAVARVRRVREQDSRSGLLVAVREAARDEERLHSLASMLDGLPSGGCEAMASFVAMRASMLVLEQVLTEAQSSAAASRNLATSAREHWQQDRSRLAAIEMLQERRRDEARAEAARAEARALDEAATQLWQRRAQEGAA